MKFAPRVSAVIGIGVVGMCGVVGRLPAISSPRPNRGTLVGKPADAMPIVPAGFTVKVYAEMRAPRMMVYAPNGDLFVSSPAANNITVLRDANNDGVFESRSVYAGTPAAESPVAPPAAAAPPPPPPVQPVVNPTVNGPVLGASAPACMPPPPFNNPGPGTVAAPFGMAFHDGYLYVGNTGSLVRFKYTSGDLKAQGEPEKLLDLPTGGHSTRNVTFNRAGTKMYVSVGSQSNNNAGEDCRRAAILEFNPDGSGFRVFASGIRNPVGLAWQPGTDILWTAMNERDNLGDDLVPDYATSVKELVKRAIVPDVLFPAHSAALGITFYTGTQFPQRYRNGAFVALHGSWNRSMASGYRLAFVPMTNGKPGPLEDFMTGFVIVDGEGGAPLERWGRPVGVTVAADGGLLVSDDGSNKIWKISAAR